MLLVKNKCIFIQLEQIHKKKVQFDKENMRYGHKERIIPIDNS